MPVTVRDIANRAGVHHSTVSRALRNDPQVGTETRKRIRALAQKMGYQPSPALSALAAYRSSIRQPHHFEKIAVLCRPGMEEDANGTLRDQWKGIQRRCKQRGFQPELFPVTDSEREQAALSKSIYNRGIRGIIATPFIHSLRGFAWEKFCAVGIAENSDPLLLNYVSYDHDESIRVTYQQLKDRGYRNIGYVNEVDSEARNRHLQLAAFLKFRNLDGFTDAPYFLHHKQGIDLISDWARKHHLDALILSGIRHVSFLLDSGFDIPQRFGVAIASNTPSAASKSKIASYVIDRLQFGILAVDALQGLIQTSAYGVPRAEKRYSMLLRGKWQNGWTVRPRVRQSKHPASV